MKNIELIAAPYTPFHANGSLDTQKISEYASYLKSVGVKGVFVNGTTGEGASMSAEERLETASSWIKHQSADFKVIIHVGDNQIETCKRLALHAASIKADAVGLISPTYFKPDSLQALVQFNLEVASIVPQLPYFYYHIPSMTGVDFRMIDFIREADGIIKNFAGVKFTHHDLIDFNRCLHYKDQKFKMFQGRDEFLIAGLAMGATAAIGSTYNYITPLYIQLIEAFTAGDMVEANRIQLEAVKIIEILIKYGGAVKPGKAFMRAVGIDLGQPRLPIIGYDIAKEKTIIEELKDTRFFEYSK